MTYFGNATGEHVAFTQVENERVACGDHRNRMALGEVRWDVEGWHFQTGEAFICGFERVRKRGFAFVERRDVVSGDAEALHIERNQGARHSEAPLL